MESAKKPEITEERGLSKCAERRFRRNYLLGIINGTMFRGSRIFIDEDTIIPIFIASLTQSKFLVGLAVGLRLSGWFFPQIFVANWVGAKDRKHPTYIAWGAVRVVAILAIVLSVWLVGAGNPTLLLTLFFVFWAGLYFSAGMTGVSFVEVVAKTIPDGKLGSFYGYRMFFAGLVSLASGFLIVKIQAVYSYPTDYALIFMIAFLMITGGIVSWSLAREQRDIEVRPKKPLFAHLRESAEIFREDSRFRSLFGFKAAFYLWNAGVPFFILFFLDMEDFAWIAGYKGYLAMTKVIGLSVSNLLWARMANSERLGRCRGILTTVSAIAIVLPFAVIALSRPEFSGFALPAMFGVFFFIGTIQSGMVIGYMNTLIRISPAQRRPLYIGLMNSMLGPIILGLALLGGGVVEIFSYKVMFTISALAAVLALICARRLSDA